MEALGNRVIGNAIEVHSVLGPGLLESTYERCLVYELQRAGITAERQVALPILYKGMRLEEGYRMDILVEKSIVLELKSVERLKEIHVAQLITYLKLSGCTLGFLLNFNVPLMKDGIKRIVNNHPDP